MAVVSVEFLTQNQSRAAPPQLSGAHVCFSIPFINKDFFLQ
jgi:hypothetical protein